MATQLVSVLVISQADIAIWALGHMSAGGTFHHWGKTPSVLKKYDLLPLLQGFGHRLDQNFGKMSFHAPFTGRFLDIHQIDFRHQHLSKPIGNGSIAIFLGLGVVHTLNAWRSGTQNNVGLVYGSQNHGSIPCVVTWSWVKLFKRGFMLLIHHHQSQLGERKEKRRTGTNNYLGFLGILQHIVPHLYPFVNAVFGMINGYLISKIMPQPIDQLGGQRNFWKQIQGLFALFQAFLNQFDVHLGLSRGGDPV